MFCRARYGSRPPGDQSSGPSRIASAAAYLAATGIADRTAARVGPSLAGSGDTRSVSFATGQEPAPAGNADRNGGRRVPRPPRSRSAGKPICSRGASPAAVPALAQARVSLDTCTKEPHVSVVRVAVTPGDSMSAASSAWISSASARRRLRRRRRRSGRGGLGTALELADGTVELADLLAELGASPIWLNAPLWASLPGSGPGFRGRH